MGLKSLSYSNLAQMNYTSAIVGFDGGTVAAVVNAMEGYSVSKGHTTPLTVSRISQVTGYDEAEIATILSFLLHSATIRFTITPIVDSDGEAVDAIIEDISFGSLKDMHVPWGTIYQDIEIRTEYQDKPYPVEVPVPFEVPVPMAVDLGAQELALARKRKAWKVEAKLEAERVNKDRDILHQELVWQSPPAVPVTAGKVRLEWMEEFFEVIKWRHVALIGPPGTGKSTAAEMAGTLHNMPTNFLPADTGLHRRDVSGSASAKNGVSYISASGHATAAHYGWYSVLDEINMALADAALPVVMSQLDSPHSTEIGGKHYPVHPNFRAIVTMNRGLAGNKTLNAAFLDRFYVIEVPYPTESALREILIKGGCADEEQLKYLLKVANLFWSNSHTLKTLRYTLSMRRLTDTIITCRVHPDWTYQEALKYAILPYVDKVEVPDVLNLIKSI